MWFVTLVKFKHQPTKADTDKMTAYWAEGEKKWGVKRHMGFYTLGRYDAVFVSEAPDEKTAMKFALWSPNAENVATETLVAVDRNEAVSWLK